MSGVARGKKTRNKRSLKLFPSQLGYNNTVFPEAYMTVKHAHWTPTWAIPKSPAKHANPDTSWQQSRFTRLAGRVRMLAKAKVPDVVPSSTK